MDPTTTAVAAAANQVLAPFLPFGSQIGWLVSACWGRVCSCLCASEFIHVLHTCSVSIAFHSTHPHPWSHQDVTTATPEPYLLIKEALLSLLTSSLLQMCFELYGRPSALFTEMQYIPIVPWCQCSIQWHVPLPALRGYAHDPGRASRQARNRCRPPAAYSASSCRRCSSRCPNNCFHSTNHQWHDLRIISQSFKATFTPTNIL